jgi:hypothetical protein
MMASLTATACAAKLKQQSTRCHQYQPTDQDQAAGGSTNQIRVAPSLSGRWKRKSGLFVAIRLREAAF